MIGVAVNPISPKLRERSGGASVGFQPAVFPLWSISSHGHAADGHPRVVGASSMLVLFLCVAPKPSLLTLTLGHPVLALPFAVSVQKLPFNAFDASTPGPGDTLQHLHRGPERSLDLWEGAFFSRLGHSGCGKTTVPRMTAGLQQPFNGGVLFDGWDMQGLPTNNSPPHPR